MAQRSPLVSVVVPCFNHARYLGEALSSVAAQTHQAWECLIVDDGSTDETREVAVRFVDRDPRYRYLHHAHIGQAASRNRALSNARGELIQFLDADDVILPEKIQRQVEALGRGNGLQVAHCDYFHGRVDSIMEPDRKLRMSPLFIYRKPMYDLALRWETELSIPIHCFLFDAGIFRDHGVRFDETLPNHEDWDCWMHVFALEPKSIYLDGVLTVYRASRSVSRDNQINYAGFQSALSKQQRIWLDDPIMSRLLGLMAKRIKHSYRHVTTRRGPVFDLKTRLGQSYRRVVPWPVQQAVTRFGEARRNPSASLLRRIGRASP